MNYNILLNLFISIKRSKKDKFQKILIFLLANHSIILNCLDNDYYTHYISANLRGFNPISIFYQNIPILCQLHSLT